MDPDRIAWTHYRARAGGREPITSSHAGVDYRPLRRVGLGCITSRRPPADRPEFDLLAAIKNGARPCPPPSR